VSRHAVQTALEELRQALPFRLRGIDSDNGLPATGSLHRTVSMIEGG
jgi:hypothetical protein